MTVLRLVVAICIYWGSVLFANPAIAENQSVDFTSSDKAQANDISLSSSQDGDCKHDNDCDHEFDCGPNWHWIGGVEATYLDPRFHASGNPQADQSLKLVDPGWTAAPRIWLGMENSNGWGSRVRYWQLSDEQSRFDITNIQPSSVYDISQTLKMYDIDAEVTKRMELGSWNLLGSFGGRFASLARLDSASAFDTTPPADTFEFLFNNQTNAGGITGSIEVSRPIGIGAWEVFGLFRASELWGNTNASFDMRENNNGTPSSNDFSDRFNSDLTIWEAQVGLQCSKYVECCGGMVLARCGFEYQSWNWTVPGGNPGGGGIFNPGVDLYGVAFAVGFTH
jgi:hypothetical protein